MANEPVIQVVPKMRSLKYNGTNSAQIINGLNVTANGGTVWSVFSEIAGVLTVRRTIQDKVAPESFNYVINTNDVLITGQDNTGLGEILNPVLFAQQYYVLP
jgi:hypothetical protein